MATKKATKKATAPLPLPTDVYVSPDMAAAQSGESVIFPMPQELQGPVESSAE